MAQYSLGAGKVLEKQASRRSAFHSVASGIIVGVVAAKWLTDAYTVDKNVGSDAPTPYWNSTGSGFTPWPHLGDDLSKPCHPQPPSYIECQPRGVPDLGPVDKAIHDFLNLKIPFADIPIAPVVVILLTMAVAFGIYRLASRRRRNVNKIRNL